MTVAHDLLVRDLLANGVTWRTDLRDPSWRESPVHYSRYRIVRDIDWGYCRRHRRWEALD